MYKLVIIDDEKKILEGIAQIFPWNQIGFEVVGKFTSAEAALAYLKDDPADVVMTDIRMPNMTGLELVRALKEYPDMKVVIFSSYTEYQYMREALLLDVTDYLLKPVNYNDLVTCFEKIRAQLDEKNAVSEAAQGSYYEKLLMDPSYKSYEIAYLVGYDNPKNFTRAFKAYYQVTPRDYRNGIRSPEEPVLQRAGHSQAIEGADGNWYMSHLCFRPVKRCSILGRESAIQNITWTEDGWFKISANDTGTVL